MEGGGGNRGRGWWKISPQKGICRCTGTAGFFLDYLVLIQTCRPKEFCIYKCLGFHRRMLHVDNFRWI